MFLQTEHTARDVIVTSIQTFIKTKQFACQSDESEGDNHSKIGALSRQHAA